MNGRMLRVAVAVAALAATSGCVIRDRHDVFSASLDLSWDCAPIGCHNDIRFAGSWVEVYYSGTQTLVQEHTWVPPQYLGVSLEGFNTADVYDLSILAVDGGGSWLYAGGASGIVLQEGPNTLGPFSLPVYYY